VDNPTARAAGICFATLDGRILLMHRVDGQGWAFPGGGIEGEETAEQAARREVLEETGLEFTDKLTLWTRRARDGVDFTTFLAPTEEFVPTLNNEHDAYQWADRRFALNSPDLHPGVYIALKRFEMDELGVAKAMVAGEITSPQRYGNMLLISIRVTGTGHSFRYAHDEHVWRDPSLYMNPEFLERCNGLPVVLEHPKKNMLTTKEFRDRIVGTIFVPYFKEMEQEVWCIAKIWDMDMAEILESEKTSTSPAVVFMGMSPGEKLPLSDGKHLLIENKPSLLDHLALLVPDEDSSGAGVWDKGLELSGVESVDAIATADSEPSALDLILRKAQLNEICHRIR
jgi:8-oxo-dGTP pyrophosphatase MutT (NUDIX family)